MRFSLAMIGLASLLHVAAATACSFPVRRYSEQEIRQMAEQAFAKATTIIDGEVVSPMTIRPDLPEGVVPVAWIKVSHTWKGQVEENVASVAYMSSCDLSLEIKGQKVRILLYNTGIFQADQEMNGHVAVYQQAEFNREIDRLVGSRRPTDFTEPGSPPPPEKP
jgi:hypothetical protein